MNFFLKIFLPVIIVFSSQDIFTSPKTGWLISNKYRLSLICLIVSAELLLISIFSGDTPSTAILNSISMLSSDLIFNPAGG